MARVVKQVFDMELDEVSTVDIPANQHGRIVIAKRAPEEDTVPEIFDDEGNALTEDALSHGQVVYTADGDPLVFLVEGEELPDGLELDDSEYQQADEEEQEYAGVAKRGRSFADEVRETLSKALTDVERDDVISKAAVQISKAEQRAAQAEAIARSERDLRLTREYVAKAATYNLPIEPTELGPVLMRMVDTMSEKDCAVIAKALDAASALVGQEIGYQGAADNNDVLTQVDMAAEELVSKSATDPVSKAAAVTRLFETNPRAYDEYLASRPQ